MDNFRKANMQLWRSYNLTIKKDFHRGAVFSSFLITKSHYLERSITLSNFYLHVPFKTSCEHRQV